MWNILFQGSGAKETKFGEFSHVLFYPAVSIGGKRSKQGQSFTFDTLLVGDTSPSPINASQAMRL
jgi:hypothetical protein